jgi:hypothetical protein
VHALTVAQARFAGDGDRPHRARGTLHTLAARWVPAPFELGDFGPPQLLTARQISGDAPLFALSAPELDPSRPEWPGRDLAEVAS